MTALPREFTAARVLPLRGTIYAEARKIALSADADWPRMLGAAQTLSQSPDWTDTRLARHIREAYSLHCAELLKPVDPSHRDRSDLIDQWKEAALQPETSRDIARAVVRDRLPEVLIYAAIGAVVILRVAGWL